jgi:hypothetical protein
MPFSSFDCRSYEFLYLYSTIVQIWSGRRTADPDMQCKKRDCVSKQTSVVIPLMLAYLHTARLFECRLWKQSSAYSMDTMVQDVSIPLDIMGKE